MASITYRVLSESIDVAEIEEQARKAWESKNARRRSLAQWITWSLPGTLVVVFTVFYLLSAPHTVAMLDVITPGWGWISPVGFELAIVILAAIQEVGWSTRLTKSILMALLLVAIIVNVSGGFISVVSHDTPGDDTSTQAVPEEAIEDLTVSELWGRYGALSATKQITIFLAVIIGVLIPVMGKFTGEVIIKLAMGKIILQTEDTETQWAKSKAYEVRNALMSAALKLGAGHKTASNWSAGIVQERYRDDYLEVFEPAPQAIGKGAPRPLASPMPAPSAKREIGFVGMAGQRGDRFKDSHGVPFTVPVPDGNYSLTHDDPSLSRIDTKDSPGQGTGTGTEGQQTLTRAAVRTWLKANPDRWQEMSNHDISAEIIGTDSGYKTVQRTLRDLGLRR